MSSWRRAATCRPVMTCCRSVRLLLGLRRVGREVAGGRGDRGQVLRQPVCGAGLCRVGGVAVRRLGADGDPGGVGGGVRARTRDEWVTLLAGADTCVAPVLEVAEVAEYPQFLARESWGRRRIRSRVSSRSWRLCWRGWSGPAVEEPVGLPDMTQTDTAHLLKEAGVDGETVARWMARKAVA